MRSEFKTTACDSGSRNSRANPLTVVPDVLGTGGTSSLRVADVVMTEWRRFSR